MNNLIFANNRVFISVVSPSVTEKSQLRHNWLKNGTFQRKFDKIYIFFQHFQSRYDVMQKGIENLDFVQGVNFEGLDSLKNNGTKYLLFFDESFEETQSSKMFVDNATARKHRALSTICLKHKLFHQNKFGRDVELQNTHIVLFKPPLDVMQVSTLSAQLGLGLELVDWYRDTTSVSYGLFSIDLSPRTDARLHYCRNTVSIPLKFYMPGRLEQSKFLHDEHLKPLYFASVPILFQQMQ